MTVESNAKQFGAAIRSIRKQRGLTIEALAEAANLDSTYLARVERAEQNPSLSVVGKIADALDLPLSHLVDFDRPSAAQTRARIKRQLAQLDEKQLRAVTLFIDAMTR